MADYAYFISVPDEGKAGLLEAFMEDLAQMKDTSEQMKSFMQGIEFLQGRKSLSYNIAYHDKSNAYLLCLNGKSERVMHEAAKLHDFPRGCPVVWIPKTYMKVAGFYPKFENDTIVQGGFDMDRLDNAQEISLVYKWSGFLVQFGAFSDGTSNYWFACTKRMPGSDNEFAAMAKELVEAHITNDLVDEMIRDGLYIGAEGMSPRDNTHGYVAIRDALVVTCVSFGTEFRLSHPEVSRQMSPVCTFMEQEEVLFFCWRHVLSCGSVYKISGENKINNFVRELLSNRDFATYPNVSSLLKLRAYELAGTAEHETIAGQVLEGLIMRIRYRDGSFITLKVKFPTYIWRTMLRGVLASRTGRLVSYETKRTIENFIHRWTSSPEGMLRFRAMCKCALVLLSNTTQEERKAPNAHSKVADAVECMGAANSAALELEFDHTLVRTSPSSVRVVYLLGPIGSGKSTMGDIIQEKAPVFVHVDGDQLAGDDTEKLGSERSIATRWKVIEAVLDGKIPVLSTGGGIFYIGRALDCRSYLAECFPDSTIHVTVMIMNHAEQPGPPKLVSDRTSFLGNLKETFNLPMPYLEGLVKHRKGDNATLVATRSSRNASIAGVLIEQADRIVSMPVTLVDIPKSLRELWEYDMILTFPRCTPPDSCMVRQMRLIVLGDDPSDTAKHITVFFEPLKRSIEISDIKEIRDSMPAIVDTMVYSPDKVRIAVIETPMQFVESEAPHITINAGNLKPVDMVALTKAIKSWESARRPADKSVVFYLDKSTEIVNLRVHTHTQKKSYRVLDVVCE